MEVKEFKGFAIKKIDTYRTEELEPIGHINREIKVNANFGVKDLASEKEYIHNFYECKFDFVDVKTNKNIGYIYVETESGSYTFEGMSIPKEPANRPPKSAHKQAACVPITARGRCKSRRITRLRGSGRWAVDTEVPSP